MAPDDPAWRSSGGPGVREERTERWTRIVRTALLAVLLGLLQGCGDEAEGRRAEPTEWSLSAAPVVRIGEREGSSEYLFEQIASVRLLRDGRVLVADRGTSTLRLFDASGRFQAEWGGRGEGPGEYRRISRVEAVGGDTVAVFDTGLRRLTLLETDGTVLGTHRVEAPGGTPERVLGRYSNGDWALAWIASGAVDRDPSDPDADPMGIGRFGPDGRFLEVLGHGEGMVRQELGEGLGGPVPFSPFFHGVVVRDSVFFTNGQASSVGVLGEGGELARVIELDFPAEQPDVARASLREALEARGEPERVERMSEAVWSRPVPRVSNILVGARDRLWVKHYDPARDSWLVGGMGGRGPGGRWTVVDADGAVVSEITLPEDFIAMDVADGRVAGVAVDELGVERVEVFELRR